MYFTIRANSPQEMGGVPVVKVNYDSLGEDVEVHWEKLCPGGGGRGLGGGDAQWQASRASDESIVMGYPRHTLRRRQGCGGGGGYGQDQGVG